MKVNEIFLSIDGEGIRTGMPTTFIRLFGCNLRCSYCDTMYSCEVQDGEVPYKEMSVEEIINECGRLGCPNITVTGGEPLIHESINILLYELLGHHYNVNVETNGTVFPIIRHKNLFYTMDFKTLSSNMSEKMDMDAIKGLKAKDTLKFVVGTKEDLEQAVEVLNQLKTKPHIYFSPVFGKIDPKEIVQFLLDNRLYTCKVQVQLHKIIWDPNMRGV